MHRVSNVSRSFATGFAAVLLLLCCGQLAVGAGFVVTTPVDEDDGTADPGTGAGTSLREAINAANAAPDADTITFAPILVVGGDATVSLTTSLGDAATGGYGPSAFMITTDITIQGPSGDNGITITRGSGTFRLFLVTDAGSLALEDVTLSNGYATGYNGGRSAFCGGGGGAGMGGAILNRGTLDLVGVTLTGNTARGGVGGDDPWPFSYGSGGGGGMGGHGQDGSGSSGGYGGGVNGGIGGMTAANPHGDGVAGGVGGGGGGGGQNTESFGGNGGFGGGGGGAYDNPGDGGIGGGGGGGHKSVGVGGFGGGNGGKWAGGGGGGLGGAVFNDGGTVAVANSTFSGNSAQGGSAGPADSSPKAVNGCGYGAGLFNCDGTVSVDSTTFSANTLSGSSAAGGGIYNYQGSGTAGLTLRNTILANSSGGADAVNNGGTVTAPAGNRNLIENNSGCGTPYSTADPNLGALADNGGPTRTHALLVGSPAIDTGDTTLTTDQRGVFSRPQGAADDMGSFETPAPDMDVQGGGQSIDDDDTMPATADDTDFGELHFSIQAKTNTFTIANSGADTLNLTDNPRVTIGGTHASDFTLATDATSPVASGGGTTSFVITFDPGDIGVRSATVSIANDDPDENPYNFTIQGTGVGDSNAGLDGSGNLVITDIAGENNELTVRIDGAYLVLSDPNATMSTGVSGSSGSGSNELRIPLSEITGTIIFNGGAGNDEFIVDGSAGNPLPVGSSFDGGAGGTDTLTIVDLPGAFVFDLDGDGAGVVYYGGSILLNFSDLEPIDLSGSSITTLTVNVDPSDTVAGPITATLKNNTAAGVSELTFDSGLEDIVFANPSVFFTFNGDNVDTDIINVEGVDAAWTADIIITGQGAEDTLTFQTNPTDTGGGALTVTADAVNVNAAIDTGGGDVSVDAEAEVDFASDGSIDSGNGSVTINGLNQAPVGGAVTADGNGTSVTGVGLATLLGFSVPAGTDRLLLVHVGTYADVTAVTFGGAPMIQGAEATGALGFPEGQSELWCLPLGSSGSATVGDIVAAGVSGGTIIGAVSFQGVDQATPVDGAVAGNFGFGASSSSVTVTSEPGDMAYDGLMVNGFSAGGPPTPGAGQTLSHGQPVAAGIPGGGASYETGSASVAMDWTLMPPLAFVQSGAHAGLNVNAASGGSGDTTITMADGSQIDAGNGEITVDTGGDVTLARLLTSGDVSVTSDNGSILDGGDTHTDLAGAGVALTAENGDLGASGNGLSMAATTLATDTSTGGGAQYLVADDPVAWNTSSAGAGTVYLSGGTFLIADGETVTAGTVDVASGVTLGGDGTISGVVSSDGTVAPGMTAAVPAPPVALPVGGIGVLTVGNTTFENNSTFDVQIGGTTPGTGAGFHDQLDVNGTVAIGTGVTLSLSAFGGYAPAGGETFTIIDNDLADAVSGTFNGLAEGATVSSDFLGSGLRATISYVGGSGNDVVLVVNAVPTDIALSPSTVAENQPVGTVVGSLSTTDADAGDSHTYSLVAGAGSTDNASFSIDGDDLKTAAVFDYETKNSYSIRVKTSDGNGGTYEEALTVTVTDVSGSWSIASTDWPASGQLTLIIDGGLVHVYETGTTTDIVPPRGMEDFTGALVITGRDGAGDTLTVDYSNGTPSPVAGIEYEGGSGAGSDTLEITGGAFAVVTHTHANANDGTIDLDGRVITYTGLEPVDMTGSTATDFIFNLPAGADNAELSEVSSGVFRLKSGDSPATFEQTDFAAPSGSVTINGGVGDTVTGTTALTMTFDVSISAEDAGFSNALGLGGKTLTLDVTGHNGTAAGALSVTGGTIVKNGTGTVAIAGQMTGTSFTGTVNVGTLELGNTGNSTTLTSGEWTVDAAATLRTAGASLGAAAVRVDLAGGTLDVDAAAGVTAANALGHYGYHGYAINTKDTEYLYLHDNQGMMGGGDPSSFHDFEGLGTLTVGPVANRGLYFTQDSHFRGVAASIRDDASGDGFVIDQNDYYANLFFGTFTPDVTGTWRFRIQTDDDRGGIWLDLDRDGVFESNPTGLGGGSGTRGEQLTWENTAWKSVTLTNGLPYLFAVTHAEHGGGSRIIAWFDGPAGAAVSADSWINPGNATQAAAGYWNFTDPRGGELENTLIVSATDATLDLGTGVSLGNLTYASAGLELDVVDGRGPADYGTTPSLAVTGLTTLAANSTLDMALAVTMQGVVQDGGAAGDLVKKGDATLVLNGANTYTGVTTIEAGIVKLGNNAGLGDEAGKTVIAAGATLDINGYRAGATGGEPVEVEGAGVGGNGAIVNGGSNQYNAFRSLSLTDDATFRSDTLWRVSNSGGPALLNLNGHTLTKVGAQQFGVVNAGGTFGNIVVSQANFYVNGTTVLGGTGTATVRSGGDLYFENFQTHSINIILDDGALLRGGFPVGGGPTLTGTVTLNGMTQIRAWHAMTISGPVTGSGGFSKTTYDGTLTLSNNANDYAGLTSIGLGTTILAADNALGTTAGATIVQDGASLMLTNNVTVPEPLLLSGNGIAGDGALVNLGNDNRLTGSVESLSATQIGIGARAGSLSIDGGLDIALANLDFFGAGDIVVNGDIAGGGGVGVQPGGIRGEYLDINEGTDLVGNRTGFSDRMFDALDPYVLPGVSDFVLQRHPITPTGDATGVITPRVDFGTGTDATQGDGSVLDRGGYSSGSVPPWQGLFNDLGITADMDGDSIAATWSGKIMIAVGGTYTFTTRSDDGSVLLVNGQRVVNNNKFQGMTNRSGSRDLAPGLHDISIGMYEGGGGAGVQASYSGPDTVGTRVIIPPTVLFNDVATLGTFVAGGLRGNYYDLNNSGANGGFDFGADEWLLFQTDPGDNIVIESLRAAVANFVSRIDFGSGTEIVPGDGTVLDRSSSTGNPYGGVGVDLGTDQIGSIFEGHITIPENADYRFTTRSDDRSVVYLDRDENGTFEPATETVAERTVLGSMGNNAGSSITLAAGTYAFKAITGEGSVYAGFQVSWEQLTGGGAFSRRILGPDALSVEDRPTTVAKNDGGTVTLAGNNTYNAPTVINGGTLLANGTHMGGGSYTVASGAILGGTGSTESMVDLNGGTLAAGVSPGILSVGDLVFDDNAIFDVEIGGTDPGTGAGFHDLVDVTGSVSISNNVTLNLSAFGGYTPVGAESYVIISNDASDAVSGTFNSLAEGATIANFLGTTLDATITYVGGDGNDVELIVEGPQYDFKSATFATAEGDATHTSTDVVLYRSVATGLVSSVDVVLVGNTATVGSDFTAGPVTITFGINETNKTVSIEILGDEIVELDETVNLSLANFTDRGTAGSTQPTAVWTIQNDDSAAFTIGNGSVVEGDSGTVQLTFDVTLSAAVDVALTVDYDTSDGTAQDQTGDGDYQSKSATLNFAGTVGEVQTATVTVNGDEKVELDETLTVLLSNVQASGRSVTASATPGTGTITNDDSAEVSIADAFVTEGDSGTVQLLLNVTVDKAVDVPFSIDYHTSDGTAEDQTGDGDYQSKSATLNFAGTVGEVQVASVTVNGDEKVELDEMLSIALSNVVASGRSVTTNATPATGTILNDDAAVFTVSSESGPEDGTLVSVLTDWDDATTQGWTLPGDGNGTWLLHAGGYVYYADGPGSGNGPFLYAPASYLGDLTRFGSGATLEFDFSILNNDRPLDAAAGIAMSDGTNTWSYVWLLNDGQRFTWTHISIPLEESAWSGSGGTWDDFIRNVSSIRFPGDRVSGNRNEMAYDNVAINGTGPLEFTVYLSDEVDAATSVDVSTSDGTATLANSDYTQVSALTLDFAAGVTSQTFEVLATPDTVVELDETYSVSLSGVVDAGRDVTASGLSGTGTIENDDVGDFGDLPAAYGLVTLGENGARHEMGSVYLGAAVDGESNGTASAGADYDDTTGTGPDDEDGIALIGSWVEGTDGGVVQVTVTGGSGYLSGWIDWDGDDSFAQVGDHVLDTVPVGAGVQNVAFNVPAGMFPVTQTYNRFVRFRLWTNNAAALDLTGHLHNGEVEDYDLPISGAAATTRLTIDIDGNLVITDDYGADTADHITLTSDGVSVTIHDPSNLLGTTIPGVTGSGTHTLTVPLTAFTGKIIVNTLGADDILTADWSAGDFIRDIDYNGGTHTLPLNGGAHPVHGDVLQVIGTGGQVVQYRPEGTVNLGLDNDGEVHVDGRVITFTGLEPVDISGMASVTVDPANGNDVIGVANGFDATSGTIPAMVVSGTSQTVPFESLHLWNNALVTINSALTADGNDTVTVNSANNAHGNGRFKIETGGGADTVTFAGAATFAGGPGLDVEVDSQSIAVNAQISAVGGTVDLDANAGAITTSGAGLDVLAASLTANGNAGVVLQTSVDSLTADTAGTPMVLTEVNGLTSVDLDAAGGDVTLTLTAGSVADGDGAVDVQGNVFSVAAPAGINLQTTIGTLNASSVAAGNITIDETDGADLLSVAAAAGNVAITTTTGDLNVFGVAAVPAGMVTLRAVTGAITDGNAGFFNVSAGDLLLLGATGVGVGDGLEIDALNLEADGGSGGVFVSDGTGLIIGGVSGGLSGVQAANAGIGITAVGLLTVNETIASGGGAIALTVGNAEINSAVNAGAATVTIVGSTAARTFSLGSNGPEDIDLRDAELDRIFTTGLLMIGSPVTPAGNVMFSGVASPANAQNVRITSVGTIGDRYTAGRDFIGTTLNLDGTVGPGNGAPGILRAQAAYSFADNSSYNVELGGDTAGVGGGRHDQVRVEGTVTISNNVTLNVSSFGGFVPAVDDEFTIIRNDGVDAVVGEFQGLPEGTRMVNFLGSGRDAFITYEGDTGNDVVIVLLGIDYGDLPGVYNMTLDADNGAGHDRVWLSELQLGNVIDGEDNGVEHPSALGDDLNKLDDEGGVMPIGQWQEGWMQGTVQVTVAGGDGLLYGWADWNNDGDFNDSWYGNEEQIFSNVFVTAGVQILNFTVPVYTIPDYGTYRRFMRFRLFTNNTPNMDITGVVTNGEVEDYWMQYEGRPTLIHYAWTNSPHSFPPYTSWESAGHILQQPIDWASPGDLVLATNGVYDRGGDIMAGSISNRAAISNDITVHSVNGPDVTFIVGAGVSPSSGGDCAPGVGNGAVRGVYLDNQALLGGFTVTNGHTRNAGNTYSEQSGGGIWCENGAVVSNCIVVGNVADEYGGGVYRGGLLDTVVSGNKAGDDGGGTWYAYLTNCTVTLNATCDDGGGSIGGRAEGTTYTGNTAVQEGGGAQIAVLTDCVLTANTADRGGGASGCTMDDCTLGGNTADWVGGGAYGGTLNSCIVTGNTAYTGAGIGNSTVIGSTIAYNLATDHGGGASQGALTDCLINGNVASNYGGGVSKGELQSCLVISNTAPFGGGARYGVFYSCTVAVNQASWWGGGVMQSTMYDSIVSNNVATTNGGGAYGSLLYSTVVRDNSAAYGGGMYEGKAYNALLVDNTASALGGGAYRSFLLNSTVTENTAASAGGTYAAFVVNGIVYFNTPDNVVTGTTLFTCSTPLQPGNDNIAGDPQFTTPGTGNYRLRGTSPCYDVGTNLSVSGSFGFEGGTYQAILTDLDGEIRPQDGGSGNVEYDMGAYERIAGASPSGPAALEDVDGDGMNGWAEYVAVTDAEDEESTFRISDADEQNGFTAYVASHVDRVYTLEWNSAPAEMGWEDVPGQQYVPGTGGWLGLSDSRPANGPRYYRIRVDLP